ncbi:MAG: signal transduction protein [Pseudanabaena frigida]|uniref:Signal transduction protein n=1 Tax=Pseudanabaena frigida TaxID=945775 RepID=A0A2W4Y2W6_9CYAN|nr:MAG: signal transduction protein [Pseudanabaena frigida]
MELVDVQSRSTISNFFAGKPVDRQIFVKICEKLEINWQEISGQLPSPTGRGAGGEGIDIEALVKLARERCAEDIRKRCGTMRVLDMEQPVALSDIYTDVNILEKITRNQRKELEEFRAICGFEEFDRWGLSGIKQKRVEGIEAVRNHSKLMILGKPGAGKTTFLKFLAMSCISGKDFVDWVPIFVTLKDFADRENRPSLLQFLTGEFSQWDIEIEAILKSGKTLVLMDGLDEVRAEHDDRILREIRELARNYSESQMVVTCRIATKEYTFEQFTEVEIADFDERQIATFAGNWFCKKEIKSEDFLAKLEQNNRVQQLATSPLLLTLLCLAFDESGKFPANRSELYKEGLDALLRKWDSKRRIRRDSVYKDFSVQKKEDLLSQIALTTFEKGDYFIKQRQLEDYICDYIRNTSNAKTEEEELHLDSEAVLKSIEAQHGLFVERARGIYSFSHLTFHEYFAARQIVVSTSPSKLEAALQNLVTHITDKRWREVILLSVGIAREADDLLLLMKRKIDSLLEEDDKLQSFLSWVDEKSRSIKVSYKLVAVRVYYFNIALDLNRRRQELTFDRDHDDDKIKLYVSLTFDYTHCPLTSDLDCNLSRDFDLIRELTLDRDLNLVLDRILANNIRNRDRIRYFDCDKEIGYEKLYQRLQALNYQLTNPKRVWNDFIEWWERNNKRWIAEYRQVLIEHRNIGHDWQFTDEQRKKLEQYYQANRLLVECLKSDCYVQRETRQEIEESLLLPSKR